MRYAASPAYLSLRRDARMMPRILELVDLACQSPIQVAQRLGCTRGETAQTGRDDDTGCTQRGAASRSAWCGTKERVVDAQCKPIVKRLAQLTLVVHGRASQDSRMR